MALGVTGVDGNGRVTPKGTNVVIPPENAGVGDLIYKSGGTVKVIGRGTASGASISIGGTTYTLYGAIFGFINGEAMIVAPNGAEVANTAWAGGGSAPSWLTKYYPSGSVLMRNKLNTSYYAQMNTATNAGYITGGGSAPVQLSSAYQATSLTSSNFDSNASAEIKRKYKTWNEYIRQTLRVNGAPGTPFGAVFDGCKVHEYGRYVTNRIGDDSSFPACRHCYNYQGALGTDAKGTWWLPSMFELAELMIDEHLNKVNENSSVLSVSAGLLRWSSVLLSGSDAWSYYLGGMSDYNGLTYSVSWMVVRPVTLLKLV